MSANLDLVRSIFAAWERGDFRSTEWAHPNIEFVRPDGPEPGTWIGIPEMSQTTRDILTAWEAFRQVPDEFREVDAERVLVLFRGTGRGKRSGVDLQSKWANVFHLHDGKVTRMLLYYDRDRALADLGLERAMPEESTTPDPVELGQRLTDAINARETDVVVSLYAPDAVFDQFTFGVFEGRPAIRSFIEDWFGAYDEIETEVEERRDLGHGLTFIVYVQRGRLRGSTRWVHARVAFINAWADGFVQRTTVYEDIDQARAAAEGLAEERR